jgi:hypothetical protein
MCAGNWIGGSNQLGAIQLETQSKNGFKLFLKTLALELHDRTSQKIRLCKSGRRNSWSRAKGSYRPPVGENKLKPEMRGRFVASAGDSSVHFVG